MLKSWISLGCNIVYRLKLIMNAKRTYESFRVTECNMGTALVSSLPRDERLPLHRYTLPNNNIQHQNEIIIL